MFRIRRGLLLPHKGKKKKSENGSKEHLLNGRRLFAVLGFILNAGLLALVFFVCTYFGSAGHTGGNRENICARITKRYKLQFSFVP